MKQPLGSESDEQGDQIGRFFAYWVIACFGQFFENCGNSPIFGQHSFFTT
jgi:hypothetical protein